jgi:hypothetical protein
MRRHLLPVAFAVTVLTALAALTGSAHAKGPSEGVIEDERLAAPVAISGGGGDVEGGDGPFWRLVEEAGFFEASFGEGRGNPLMATAPTTDLGLKLTVRWTVPGPTGELHTIVQDLYPGAAGGPLVYTAGGQPFFEIEETFEGWFRARPGLAATLTELGIPDLKAPRTAPPTTIVPPPAVTAPDPVQAPVRSEGGVADFTVAALVVLSAIAVTAFFVLRGPGHRPAAT